MDIKNQRLLTYEEVQERLGHASRSTIKTLVARGEIEKVNISDRRAGFPEDAVIGYIGRLRDARRKGVAEAK